MKMNMTMTNNLLLFLSISLCLVCVYFLFTKKEEKKGKQKHVLARTVPCFHGNAVPALYAEPERGNPCDKQQLVRRFTVGRVMVFDGQGGAQ